MEKKNYIDYIVEETKKILAIDSPSGYTKEVAEYVLGEYRALGSLSHWAAKIKRMP